MVESNKFKSEWL